MQRKEIRSSLLLYEQRRILRPVVVVMLNLLLCAAGFALVLLTTGTIEGLCGSALITVGVTRCFIVAHDACHQSLTPNRNLNKMIGRIAFLPSFTPYSLWELGHNLLHHSFTNLRGKDHVWSPVAVDEYLMMSARRKFLYRIYRSWMGPGLYYFVELWWKSLAFPGKEFLTSRRAIFTWDRALVYVFFGLLLSLLIAKTAQGQLARNFVLVFVIPGVLWNWIMGAVTYLHHTHPDIPWFNVPEEWASSNPFTSTTIHVRVGRIASFFFHNIFEHTAHHLSMRIPYYNLSCAQRLTESKVHIKSYRFSVAKYLDVTARCKLYDFSSRTWVPFP